MHVQMACNILNGKIISSNNFRTKSNKIQAIPIPIQTSAGELLACSTASEIMSVMFISLLCLTYIWRGSTTRKSHKECLNVPTVPDVLILIKNVSVGHTLFIMLNNVVMW